MVVAVNSLVSILHIDAINNHSLRLPKKLGWFNDAVVTVTQNSIISVSLKGHVDYQPGVSNQDPVIVRIDVSGSTENCK